MRFVPWREREQYYLSLFPSSSCVGLCGSVRLCVMRCDEPSLLSPVLCMIDPLFGVQDSKASCRIRRLYFFDMVIVVHKERFILFILIIPQGHCPLRKKMLVRAEKETGVAGKDKGKNY